MAYVEKIGVYVPVSISSYSSYGDVCLIMLCSVSFCFHILLCNDMMFCCDICCAALNCTVLCCIVLCCVVLSCFSLCFAVQWCYVLFYLVLCFILLFWVVLHNWQFWGMFALDRFKLYYVMLSYFKFCCFVMLYVI